MILAAIVTITVVLLRAAWLPQAQEWQTSVEYHRKLAGYVMRSIAWVVALATLAAAL
jgi:hypothetical protein